MINYNIEMRNDLLDLIKYEIHEPKVDVIGLINNIETISIEHM